VLTKGAVKIHAEWGDALLPLPKVHSIPQADALHKKAAPKGQPKPGVDFVPWLLRGVSESMLARNRCDCLSIDTVFSRHEFVEL
jgi:hypothetical protein